MGHVCSAPRLLALSVRACACAATPLPHGFGLLTGYPQLDAPLSPASTPVSGCKLVITATRAAGWAPALGEVRFLDAAGDVLHGLIADTLSDEESNPGGRWSSNREPKRAHDWDHYRCWRDDNGVPSTLVLSFTAASTFAAYDLKTGMRRSRQTVKSRDLGEDDLAVRLKDLHQKLGLPDD